MKTAAELRNIAMVKIAESHEKAVAAAHKELEEIAPTMELAAGMGFTHIKHKLNKGIDQDVFIAELKKHGYKVQMQNGSALIGW